MWSPLRSGGGFIQRWQHRLVLEDRFPRGSGGPRELVGVGCGDESEAVPGSLRELWLVAGQRVGPSLKQETERRGKEMATQCGAQ